MSEQEKYKRVLKKVIDATENDKIKTSDELIKTLIMELSSSTIMKQQSNSVSEPLVN
ncbi:hypothetical protein [Ornithinibacillus gellani]|uniref:hypothetical protein n=1 Tax=Ornithinibacillus gellani TaxID=2293253 RepID=UPI00168093E2|nr:hypothetical protein [Ornithinibacillus gellani]